MHDERKAPPANPASQTHTDPRQVDSAELLGSADELLIRHAGRLYRLRRTRTGKLILT